MNNKNILYILIIILLYLNIYSPLVKDNIELKQKTINIKQSITKDKLYISHQNQILRDLNQSKSSFEDFKLMHFYQVKNLQVFNTMQKQLKEWIKRSKIKEDNINWGETYKNGNFIEFPIRVRVYGSISKIGNFFNMIYIDKKIYIKSFIIRRTKEYYILELSLYGLKSTKNV